MTEQPKPLVICTDLDRTLLPNGHAAESPEARATLAKLRHDTKAILIYASGRSKELIQDAIQEYDLPLPNFAIADVGATLYEIQEDTSTFGQWDTMPSWHAHIGMDWHQLTSTDLKQKLSVPEACQLQGEAHQKPFKLSFFTKELDKLNDYCNTLSEQAKALNIACNIIPSVNEIEGDGLIDVLPVSADKLFGLRFLQSQYSWPLPNIVFCGDSGNDMSALTSEFQGILVANATDEVKSTAIEMSKSLNRLDQLYVATGAHDKLNGKLNGNYAAGIIEGLLHYHPHLRLPGL